MTITATTVLLALAKVGGSIEPWPDNRALIRFDVIQLGLDRYVSIDIDENTVLDCAPCISKLDI